MSDEPALDPNTVMIIGQAVRAGLDPWRVAGALGVGTDDAAVIIARATRHHGPGPRFAWDRPAAAPRARPRRRREEHSRPGVGEQGPGR